MRSCPPSATGSCAWLYRAIAADGSAVCLVAEAGGEVVGFGAGAVSTRRFSRRFYLRHAIPALVAAGARLAKPRVLHGVLENVRFLRGDGGGPALPAAEMMSLAVAPAWRSRGLAGRLAEAVLAELAELGAREVRVLVGAGNTQGNRLYERLGLELRGEVTLHRGARSNVWVAPCRH